MKTFHFILSLMLIFVTFSSHASENSSTKRQISQLAREIQDALLDTSASESNLNSAKDQLRAALNLIRERNGGGNGPGSSACIDFAYEKYYRTLSSADALDKAGEACRMTDSLDVMKFLYEKFYSTLSAGDAMTLAARSSIRPMSGKLEIVSFAYEKYYRVKNATDSAKLAADNARKVSSGSMECLSSAYTKYYQTKNASDAMDAAFAFCQR